MAMLRTTLRCIALEPWSQPELALLGPGVKYIGGKPRQWDTWPERKIMKWTTLTFKELAAQRTLRMDAKYWIKKKQRATSSKPQASSGKRLTCKWK